MRHKELRIALVCYGGVSLAVYMHGVTKELWHLSRTSRDETANGAPSIGVEAVYRDLLQRLAHEHGLRLRVLADILSGASAGGINAIFLAQAIHTGQSLDPLTDLWLTEADVDRLTHPDARPFWRFGKFWFQPIIAWALRRPGNAISESVAPETRKEVRRKISRFVRGRWFEPPFSGPGFAALLEKAFTAMAAAPAGSPLLPPGHPIDLFVTATDFRGHRSLLRLHSPAIAEESEHRVPIAFSDRTPSVAGVGIADPLELVLAARATASFPGAFPPATLDEIDRLAAASGRTWTTREDFIDRVLGPQKAQGRLETLALIDGSVLVNKPFEGAIAALRGRPAQREVDRRFVYVDPHPFRASTAVEESGEVGFFATIFGALSTIPREQPIRDNLEALEAQSRDASRLQGQLAALRPEVDATVEKLFGYTLFFDRPTTKRLRNWRQKAQAEAVRQAGYAFGAYSQIKLAGIVSRVAQLIADAVDEHQQADLPRIEDALQREIARRGLSAAHGGQLDPETILFLREHDLAFRIRRLRLLARRLSLEWEAADEASPEALQHAREAIYGILALYFERENVPGLGRDFAEAARNVLAEPGATLDMLAERRRLAEVDDRAEIMLAELLESMPVGLRRQMLLTYLGFPFYDTATLTIAHNEALTEYEAVKVDRISPEDATSIREGGTKATLKGTEFFNFGAFFSRAYRENDYLWGRLHGAERMIDIACSVPDAAIGEWEVRRFKRAAFLAILEEERTRLTADPRLIPKLKEEILAWSDKFRGQSDVSAPG